MIKLGRGFLRCSYPPIITPFKANGAVDIDSFRRCVDFSIRNASHGILLSGTTSEPSSMTIEERITLFTTHFRDGDGAATVTLDAAPETLAVRIGTALRSRLDEMCRVVPMEGHDYRRSFLRAADRW